MILAGFTRGQARAKLLMFLNFQSREGGLKGRSGRNRPGSNAFRAARPPPGPSRDRRPPR